MCAAGMMRASKAQSLHADECDEDGRADAPHPRENLVRHALEVRVSAKPVFVVTVFHDLEPPLEPGRDFDDGRNPQEEATDNDERFSEVFQSFHVSTSFDDESERGFHRLRDFHARRAGYGIVAQGASQRLTFYTSCPHENRNAVLQSQDVQPDKRFNRQSILSSWHLHSPRA